MYVWLFVGGMCVCDNFALQKAIAMKIALNFEEALTQDASWSEVW